MFKNLTNFSRQRNRKEAFGFYLAYLFLFILVGAMVAAIICVATNTVPKSFTDVSNFGEQIGAAIVAIGCAIVSLAILWAKKEYRYSFILLALISGILSFFGGSLFGFVVPAYFTTLPFPADTAAMAPDGKSVV